MHHELFPSIRSTLHINKKLENCGASGLPKSSRDLLDKFLYRRVDACFFYTNACLNEKCSECGGLSKFDICFDEGANNILGRK